MYYVCGTSTILPYCASSIFNYTTMWCVGYKMHSVCNYWCESECVWYDMYNPCEITFRSPHYETELGNRHLDMNSNHKCYFAICNATVETHARKQHARR